MNTASIFYIKVPVTAAIHRTRTKKTQNSSSVVSVMAALRPIHFLLACSFFLAALAQQACPEIPETGVKIGEPVPIVPGDIPKECSSFEILVGQFPFTAFAAMLTLASPRNQRAQLSKV